MKQIDNVFMNCAPIYSGKKSLTKNKETNMYKLNSIKLHKQDTAR